MVSSFSQVNLEIAELHKTLEELHQELEEAHKKVRVVYQKIQKKRERLRVCSGRHEELLRESIPLEDDDEDTTDDDGEVIFDEDVVEGYPHKKVRSNTRRATVLRALALRDHSVAELRKVAYPKDPEGINTKKINKFLAGMKLAGLVHRVSRAVWGITPEGRTSVV